MKRLTAKLLLLALVLTMLLSAVSTANALVVGNAPTDASVTFRAAGLIIDPDPDPNDPDIDFSKFELNFGSREIPVMMVTYVGNGKGRTADGSALYPDADANAADPTAAKVGITVRDARNPAASNPGWELAVKMQPFIRGSKNLNGTLRLINGTTQSTNSGATATNFRLLTNDTINSQTGLRIETSNTYVPALQGTNTLGVGKHSVSWTNDNVWFTLASTFAANMEAGEYQAVVTWQLEEK